MLMAVLFVVATMVVILKILVSGGGVSVESGDYELEAAFLTNDPTNASKTKTLSKPLCHRLCIWIWLIKVLL